MRPDKVHADKAYDVRRCRQARIKVQIACQGLEAKDHLGRHRWVVERMPAWLNRFRRLAKDYERLPETVVGLHFVAFACLLLYRATALLGASP
jgi:transposase